MWSTEKGSCYIASFGVQKRVVAIQLLLLEYGKAWLLVLEYVRVQKGVVAV